MKKTAKFLVAMLCAAAMLLGICGTAFAAEAPEYDLETVYMMAQRALDQQAIQNVMSRHVMYHCYGLHHEELENIWVQEPENRATASFGQNQGFFVGYPAIWEAYAISHDSTWLSSAKSYCEKNGIDIEGWTDEEILDTYGGVGQLLLHVTTTAIIEVAADGKTAKCFWYSPGMISESGSAASTIWEAYGVDFVKEGNEWKMWHLHMFTDFMGSFYIDLGGQGAKGAQGTGESDGGESDGEAPADMGDSEGDSEGDSADSSSGEAAVTGEAGAQVAAETAQAYLYDTQYYQFSADRLRSDMELFIPTAYDTWSFDDENFGLTREQYESYGIDLDAWYAAH